MKSSRRPSTVADYLLDTNVLILHLRECPDITALLTRWGTERPLFISIATRTGTLVGMRPHEEERTREVLDSLENLPVDEAIADRAGRLIHQYARQGIQLSFPDALIAATALHHDLTLVTTNPKHFPMPDLRLHPLGNE
jgi:predicted nucleic acid-binding protein